MKDYLSQAVWMAVFVLGIGTPSSVRGQSNDHIFPSAVSAKAVINFDSRGFLINGKRVFLVSAGMEYARVPHELWRDRLLRLKRDGFNCVEFYTFWNFHEPEEGKFDFSGDHDLNAFLKLVRQMGMYAIARVGPYYCAEWNLGGYPIWLRNKDSVRVRTSNAVFERYVDRYFARLLPIIANNQINHGGSVIMVQLENEHPAGWGTYVPNEYFAHLQKDAISYGIEVPYFFSGLHHGNDPAGKKSNLDDPDRPNPWFTTEFWSVWFDKYGSTVKDARVYGRRTWKIIAHGGNGYNYYMAHGGSDFGYTNSNEDAASYDYGAAVGQTGDLRPMYYQFKRNALFARSFQEILENSTGTDQYHNMVTNKYLHTNTRHSDSGDILFLDNADSVRRPTQLKLGNESLPSEGPLFLSPGEILPVVHHYALTPQVTIDWMVTRTLGISEQGNVHTIVVYGPESSHGELQFSTGADIRLLSGKEAFKYDSGRLALNLSFNNTQPDLYSFTCGNQVIRILAVSTALSDRTWFVETNGQHLVIVGPEYVGDVKPVRGGHYIMDTEHFWTQKSTYPQVWVYGSGIRKTIRVPQTADSARATQLDFDMSWMVKDASAAASGAFDDHGWKKSAEPLQMGADGDLTADAWYRTTLDIKAPGVYQLMVDKGGDRFIAFVDNKRVAAGGLDDLRFPLTAGHHQLSIFSAHDGRDKLYNFTGILGSANIKGISGKVILHKGQPSDFSGWKILKAQGSHDAENGVPSFAKASPYKMDRSRFRRGQHGYYWLQAILPAENGRVPSSVRFDGMYGNAVVFLNGTKAGRKESRDPSFSVPYVGIHHLDEPDTISVFVEGRNGIVRIPKHIDVVYKDDIVLNGWRMKGGPGDDQSPSGWKPLAINDTFDRPTFFRSQFSIKSLKSTAHPIWRVSFEGLNHGSVWVNGHNLGRYPEKIPINGLYIPECWMHPGENTIIIYDEYGNRPDKVKIQAELSSSRDIAHLTI